MTLAEFKAWFEGFTETLDGAPNEKQWERIKARVAEINGTVTSYPVFVRDYVAPWRQWWETGPSWISGPIVGNVSYSAGAGQNSFMEKHCAKSVFEPLAAMKAAGAAEYQAVLAS